MFHGILGMETEFVNLENSLIGRKPVIDLTYWLFQIRFGLSISRWSKRFSSPPQADGR
jgi:hypothetical protein